MALGLTLLCWPTSAGAFETRPFEESFGPDGTSGSSFSNPWSLAVDQSSGDIYVADWASNSDVQRLSAAHAPESFGVEFPSGVFGLSERTQIAVSSGSHDVYVLGGNSLAKAYHADGSALDFTTGANSGTNEITGSEICGVAVDANGDIYVSEGPSGVRVLTPAGEQLASAPLFGACNLAVDSHGDVYVSYPFGAVEKLTPSEFPVTATTTYLSDGEIDANPSLSVSVNPATNHVLVDEGSQVSEYDEAGDQLGSFGEGGPAGLHGSVGVAANGATGAGERIYVSNSEGGVRQVYVYGPAVVLPDVSTEPASAIDLKGAATLSGKVKPDGIALSECQFEYVDAAHYEPSAADPYAKGSTAPCVPAAGEVSTSGETSVSAAIAGLSPGGEYHFRLKAANASAPRFGGDQAFTLPPLPAIEGAEATNVARESADLSAKIDPGSLHTTYHFEWDTSPYQNGEPEGAHGHSVGAGEIAANAGSVGIGPVHIAELTQDRNYYWRVVATNEAGTTLGADHTFAYETEDEPLPDHRAYEMVTPPHKNGAVVGLAFIQVPLAIAENGSSLAAVSFQCFADAASCAVRQTDGEPFLFSRTSKGWTTTALAPPAGRFVTNTAWRADADTGMALFGIPTSPSFEDDFYAREPDGSFVDVGPSTQPSDGPSGIIPQWSTFFDFEATADFSRVFYQEPNSWPAFDESESDAVSTYEFAGPDNSRPALVGVNGEGFGNTDLISKCGTELSAGPTAHAAGEISSNGETVFFIADPCPAGTGVNAAKPVPVSELFARVDAAQPSAHTVALSEPSAFALAAPYGGCESSACVEDVNNTANWSPPCFVGAANDGSRVFFTSEQRLTDSAVQGADNLYMYDLDAPGSGEEPRLVDVSAADGGGSVAPDVQAAIAVSADGSHVYFAAGGVLTTRPNAEGETAREGASNLYVFERDAAHPGGRIAFIATPPEAPPPSANVTPDGQVLVFESTGQLTPDTTRTDGADQIFRYDAQTEQLVRVSIGRHGFDDDGNGGVGNARIVPAIEGWLPPGPSRSYPTMSNDGSYIFFESPVGLTPHALNDVRISSLTEAPLYAANIYEWHEGQVSLISDGRDTERIGSRSATQLLGSDGDGSNVFFITSDQLVLQDTDTQLDYYDARICTSESPCISPDAPPLPPCLGEDCHGTPATQTAPAGGGTSTLNGAGNLAPAPTGAPTTAKHKSAATLRAERLKRALRLCERYRGRKRRACERAARKKYGVAKQAAKKGTHR